MIFESLRVETQGVDDISALVVVCTCDRPRLHFVDLFYRSDPLCFGKFNGLHHLAEHAVCEDDDRIAVLFCDVEALIDEIRALLNAGRCKYGDFDVTVVSAACDLQVICLAGLDAADAGAAAGYVQDDQRHFTGGDETDAFLHESKTRGARGNKYAAAARCSAVCHTDGRKLGLGLDERSACLRKFMAHIFWNFVLRCDRIAEITFYSRSDRRFGKGFVSLHQDSAHDSPSSN